MVVASSRIIAASADFTTVKAVLQANLSTRSPLRIEIGIDLPSEFVDELFPLFVRQGRKARLNLVSQLVEPLQRGYRGLSLQDRSNRRSLALFFDSCSLVFSQTTFWILIHRLILHRIPLNS